MDTRVKAPMCAFPATLRFTLPETDPRMADPWFSRSVGTPLGGFESGNKL